MRQTLRRSSLLVGVATAVVMSSGISAPAATEADSPPPPETRVVGGEPTTIEQHPWAVYLATPEQQQFCGGTIAAPNKIVSAAHCFDNQGGRPGARGEPQQIGDLRVVAGRTDITSIDGTVARVTDIWIHPDYDANTMGSDVAVLTLNQDLPYQSLDLASPEDGHLYEPNTINTVVGWGLTSEGGDSSNVLRRADVRTFDDATCASAYPTAPQFYDARTMMCAGRATSPVDACQGDSGGPLVADGKLVGIVSWGEGCARPSFPGVYTRVSTFYDDIQAQLENSSPEASVSIPSGQDS